MKTPEFDYSLAEDLDHAFLNFEPNLPLTPLPDGKPNPFYVNRIDQQVTLLEKQLLAPFYEPPKVLFSGHRGCGKSTELLRLAAKPSILQRFLPIHFTIKDMGDVNNLDYRDVLLAIGSQMYNQYLEAGGDLPSQLKKELFAFVGKVEKEITTSPRYSGMEIDAALKAWLAEIGLKLKLEPKTRLVVRQVIEQNSAELVEQLNNIAAAIFVREKRWPLVLIDDMDKPDLETSQKIFYEHRESMFQPRLPVVYTIASPLFYSSKIRNLLGKPVFLPNIGLHSCGSPHSVNERGMLLLRKFVQKRMSLNLIAADALERAILYSGGVFSELARLMRNAILHTQVIGRRRVGLEQVERAGEEIRSEYRRFLTSEERAVLRAVHQTNKYDDPDKISPLLQSLAALEYANGEVWCDVHPVLVKLLEESAGDEQSSA